MKRGLYASNHRQRREEALMNTEGRCSQCKKNLMGTMKISRAYNLVFEQAHLHHPDGNPEDPNARVEILCDSCHMRAHRSKEKGKAAPRKTGYEIVRLPVLQERLASVGLQIWKTEEGRMAWQLGPLEAEADDFMDALVMAVHWMASEIHDLDSRLQRMSANPNHAVAAGGVV